MFAVDKCCVSCVFLRMNFPTTVSWVHWLTCDNAGFLHLVSRAFEVATPQAFFHEKSDVVDPQVVLLDNRHRCTIKRRDIAFVPSTIKRQTQLLSKVLCEDGRPPTSFNIR